MEPILRAAVVYFFLLILFRIAGRRTLSQSTNFDFVLLLIIGEAVQNGLLGTDYSLINSGLTITTLIFIDILISLVKQYLPFFDRLVDSTPLVIVNHGKLLTERMDRSRIDSSDVLEAARNKMGLERIEQIKYAVLEKGGQISIVPMDHAR